MAMAQPGPWKSWPNNSFTCQSRSTHTHHISGASDASVKPLDNPLFRLPSEIRAYIYDILMPKEILLHPVPGVAIASISRLPPSTSWLLIDKRTSTEIFDFFMNLTTWRIVIRYSYNFFRHDANMKGVLTWPRLRRVRNLEFVFVIEQDFLDCYPSLGLEKYCENTAKNARNVCAALTLNTNLRRVTVHLDDTTSASDWKAKYCIFQSLCLLTCESPFQCGKISSPDAVLVKKYIESLADSGSIRRKMSTPGDLETLPGSTCLY